MVGFEVKWSTYAFSHFPVEGFEVFFNLQYSLLLITRYTNSSLWEVMYECLIFTSTVIEVSKHISDLFCFILFYLIDIFFLFL